jgi:hypothetical protein
MAADTRQRLAKLDLQTWYTDRNGRYEILVPVPASERAASCHAVRGPLPADNSDNKNAVCDMQTDPV